MIDNISTVQSIMVKNIDKRNRKKLKILHQKIFSNKLYLYNDIDLIYTCTLGKSDKYIAMGQIRYESPGSHFNNGENEPYLIDFGVLPQYQQKGIGSYMIKHIITAMKIDGHKYINLDILDRIGSNDIDISNLILFYSGLGFELLNHRWYHPDGTKRYASMTLTLCLDKSKKIINI